MTEPLIPAESIGRVDLLLGHATMLSADRWDELTGRIQEAMGIVLLMAAAYPSSRPAGVSGLANMRLQDCVGQAWHDVQAWDLALAADLPDLARLRVLLADLDRDLAVLAGVRG